MTDTATWNVYKKDKKTGDLQMVLLDDNNTLRFAAFSTAEDAAKAVGQLLAKNEFADYEIKRG